MLIGIDISLGAALNTNSPDRRKRVTGLQWFFWDSRSSTRRRVFVVGEVLGV